MKWHLPSYEKIPDSPRIADDFVGVALAFPKAIELSTDSSLPVFGSFQLPKKIVLELPGRDPFRALVVLLIDGDYRPYSFNAAGQAIMLEPSELSSGMFQGYFNIDAFCMARIRPRPGRYFVSAYLDKYRTPSISVDVTGTLPEDAHSHDEQDDEDESHSEDEEEFEDQGEDPEVDQNIDKP